MAYTGSLPIVSITAHSPQVSSDSDSNAPAIFVGSQFQLYSSYYTDPAGVKFFFKGTSVEGITGSQGVTPDRSLVNTLGDPAPAIGPWYEAVLTDGTAVYAYCHTETLKYSGTKIHPMIIAQKSTDGGITFTDAGGVLIDMPAGSDFPNGGANGLGYGFTGGNGDCSAVLDRSGTYLYLFFSMYGAAAINQGIGVARMLWSDRNAPAGKFFKWNGTNWLSVGVGGTVAPVIPNVGDAYNVRAVQDYFWGPSVHYNSYLDQYVMLINRANNGDFKWHGDQMDYISFNADISDPAGWSAPQKLVFPDGNLGDWYPSVCGLGSTGTDKLAGQNARLFVGGVSNYYLNFTRTNATLPSQVFSGAGD